MIHKLNLENLLFLDIETVPETKYYSDLSEDKQKLWDSKSKYQRKEDYSPEDFYDRAGIWAEFGKIICISVGYFTEVAQANKCADEYILVEPDTHCQSQLKQLGGNIKIFNSILESVDLEECDKVDIIFINSDFIRVKAFIFPSINN